MAQSINTKIFFVSTASIFILTASLVVPSFAQNEQNSDEYWRRAGELMKSGNYSEAVQEIDHQLAQKPEDVLLLRLKGMCLTELRDYQGAVDVLSQAVKIDPENVACRFYLAQALAYQGGVVEAIENLKQVQKIAPESKYTEQAIRILPSLENLDQVAEVYPAGKRWNLTLRSSVEYDDNIPLAARENDNSTPKAGFRFVTPALYGEYRVWDQNIDKVPVTIGGGYTLYQSIIGRANLNDFRLNNQSFRAFIRRSGEFFNLPYQLGVENNVTFVRLGSKYFSTTEEIRGSLDLQLKKWMVISSFYSVDFDRFKKPGLFPEFFNRNGTTQTVGGGPTFYLFDNKLIQNFAYAYSTGGTVGSQFDQEGQIASSFTQLALPWKVRGTAGFQYQRGYYSDFVTFPRRLDNGFTISGGLSRPIFKDSLVLELNYQHTWNRSTQAFADYGQNVYGLALNYNF